MIFLASELNAKLASIVKWYWC